MDVQVCVIGGGLAGAMAALRARSKGRSVALVARSGGATECSPGTIDLYPHVPGIASDAPTFRRWVNTELSGLSHPYGLFKEEDLVKSLQDSVRFLRVALEPARVLAPAAGTFRRMATLMGSVKAADLCQAGQAAGDLAGPAAGPILIVGFEGCHETAPLPIIALLEGSAFWGQEVAPVKLQGVTIPFPVAGAQPPIGAFLAASLLERDEVLAELDAAIRGACRIDDFARVGFPPVLGQSAHARVVDQLSTRLGRPAFELLPLQPSVPGARLRHALETALVAAGVSLVKGTVVGATAKDGRIAHVTVSVARETYALEAKTFVLATGKLLGGGIGLDATLTERVFGLPVWADGVPIDPATPLSVLARDPLGPHTLFRAGVRIGGDGRARGLDGDLAFSNLWAAGTVLAGVDATRGPCTGGVSLLTGDWAGRAAAEAAL